MRRKKVNRGFSFKPDINYIRETMNMPAYSKLEWLEEMKNFTYRMLPKKTLKIWEKFRQGEI
ncbi:MAG: hypothetical protein KKD11_05675 [Candidatus Omnitrophica bacterium]|nr:hypothetical protein [Candidatus Omnitrophota bacterium]